MKQPTVIKSRVFNTKLEAKKQLESLRLFHFNLYNESSNQSLKNANDLDFEIDKLLMTLSTFIIPISLVPLTGSGLIKNLTLLDKHLLILSWVLLFVSIIIGMIEFINKKHFFAEWWKCKVSMAQSFSKPLIVSEFTLKNMKCEFNEMNDIANALNRGLVETNHNLFVGQCVLVGLGIALIMFILTRMLFL